MNRTCSKLPSCLVALLMVVSYAVLPMACGDPTDNPEDCTLGEFFDDASQLCRTCPALALPECVGGCGFFIATEEERPCPTAVCLVPTGDTCGCPSTHPECNPTTCGESEAFDPESLECVRCNISCDGDLAIDRGVCVCNSPAS